jgi:L-2-hydroxyglutarate oxidase LhgO
MSVDIEYVVFGAGVIGLACGRELAKRKKEFYILEKESKFGTGISSRNSEVIHSGIYYNTDTLKTKLCILGRRKLYDYCEEKNISYRKTGKLIVATNEDEIEKLANLFENGKKNGIEGLVWLNKQEVTKKEPSINAIAAIHSKETGIIETKELMLAYLTDLEAGGGNIVYNKFPSIIEYFDNYWKITLSDETVFTTKNIINACGLGAKKFMECIKDFPSKLIPDLKMAKGHYFSMKGRKEKISHLIYPLPQIGGLGIHLTLDLAGEVRFGPDVEWVETENYEVPENLIFTFYESIKKYLPWIESNNLQPSYAGIRPKLHGPDKKFADFYLQTEKEHEKKGLINLLGIESPGITSSLAIAELVIDILEKKI